MGLSAVTIGPSTLFLKKMQRINQAEGTDSLEPDYIAQFHGDIERLANELRRTKPKCRFAEQSAEIHILQVACGIDDAQAAKRSGLSASLYRQAKHGWRELRGATLQTVRNMFQSLINAMAVDAARVERITDDDSMKPFVADVMALRDQAPQHYETIRQMVGGLRSAKPKSAAPKCKKPA
jgi:hypothetical protein